MDTELTPALERVAASVVETHRRRQQLEDELAVAAASLASLAEQSNSLESSVDNLRREFETTLQAKKQEDLALEQLTDKRTSAVEQIDALVGEIHTYLEEKDRSANALTAHLETSRSALEAVAAEVRGLKAEFTPIAGELFGLRGKLEQVRRTVDSTEKQLEEIGSKAKDLNAEADSMAARVCRITEAVEQADKTRQQINNAVTELRSLAAALAERKAKAEAAADSVSKLAQERERSIAALIQQLEKIDELRSASLGSPNGSAAADIADAGKPDVSTNGAPARSPKTLALLDFLASQSLLSTAECNQAVQLLRDGGVDKLVRTWWSRAMASVTPGYYRVVLGQALEESGDAKGALTFYNRAMEGQKTDPFLSYLVALALLDMKRYVDVLRVAQALSRSKHGKVLAYNIEALHLAASRRLDEAEAKLAQALTMQGQAKIHYNETLYNLASLAETKGDAQAAAAWYEKLYGIDPTYRDIALHIERHKSAAPAQ